MDERDTQPGAVSDPVESDGIVSEQSLDQAAVESDPRIRPLAWLAAIGLAVVLGCLTPFADHFLKWVTEGDASLIGNLYLPVMPLFLASLAAMAWNPLARLVAPALALRPRELLLGTACLYLAAGVGSLGGGVNWGSELFAHQKLARNRKFIDTYQEQSPDSTLAGLPRAWGFTPEDEALEQGDEASVAFIRGMLDGNKPVSTFFAPIPGDNGASHPSPFSQSLSPLFATAPMMFFGLLVMIGLIAFTARQWSHHERLQHPLVQVPMALTDRTLLRDPGFRIALGVVLLFWFYQFGAQYGWHPLPQVQTKPMVQMKEFYKMFGMDAPARSTWVFEYWNSIQIVPMAIGIAFLLASDVAFSLWGGFFFLMMLFGWLYAAGIPVSFDRHGRLAGTGATMAMAVLVLWFGRHHYLRLIAAAFNPTATVARDDPMGVWGARLVLAGLFGLIAFLTASGAPLWSAVLVVLILAAFMIVISRVIAESGVACFQTADLVNRLIYGLGFPFVVPMHGILVLGWLGNTLMHDTRESLAGMAVQSTAMAERAQVGPNRFLAVILGVVLVVAFGSAVAYLAASWTFQGVNPSLQVTRLYNQVENGFKADALGLMSVEQATLLAGAVAIFAVAGLRRWWVSCPLHPIGLVVATSFPIFVIWSSLAIGWFAKVLVLRYGGSKLYKQLKPVAIGIILGDVLGFALQIVVRAIGAGLGGSMGEVWRAWP